MEEILAFPSKPLQVLIGSTRFKAALLSSSGRMWRCVNEAPGTQEPPGMSSEEPGFASKQRWLWL